MLNFERNRVENVERVCAACFVATRFLRNSTSPPSPPPSRINCGVEIREENLEGEEGEKKRREKNGEWTMKGSNAACRLGKPVFRAKKQTNLEDLGRVAADI